MGSIGRSQPEQDVLVIGAGLSGCYACYRMKKLNLRVKVLEMGSSVGGTWYFNRYPGARFDCESYTYGFTWSQELLDEWDWTEHFASQPETERYVRHICDRFQLWDYMQFNTRVQGAHWDQDSRCWKLVDTLGYTYTSRFLITGIGLLSEPTLPNVPGVQDFRGNAFHTSRWPEGNVDFEGKKVGIIGVGATAIQIIPEVAKTAKELIVFQRTPNWAIPLHNSKIGKVEMDAIRKGYPELFKTVNSTRLGFMHEANSASIWDATPEEREVFWEHLYAQPGFSFWVSNYKEILTDQKANDLVSDFIARKIKQRVKDPKIADKLIPRTHGFGLRRLPMETLYYETYNQHNVRLVDLIETPIERITSDGLKTSSENFKCDILIYATGFSAITGAFDAIDLRGINDIRLIDKWSKGPQTCLGLTVQHFPNMFMSMGPHQPIGNVPRSIEYAVGWIADCIEYLVDQDITYIEATEKGVKEWTDHVHELSRGLLSNNVDSWLTGVNKNLASKQDRIVARYSGAAPDFRRKCDEIASAHYDHFTLA